MMVGMKELMMGWLKTILRVVLMATMMVEKRGWIIG